MIGLQILKQLLVFILVLSGAVFLAMGGSSILGSPIFGILFLALGSYIIYLAIRINKIEIQIQIESILEKRIQLSVMAVLGIIAILTKNMTVGWLFLWPFWGTQPVVYMASVYSDRILPIDIGIIFYFMSLAFEGIYLYYISEKFHKVVIGR